MEEIKVCELSKMAKVLGTERALEIAEAANRVVDQEEDREWEQHMYDKMCEFEAMAMNAESHLDKIYFLRCAENIAKDIIGQSEV